MEVQALVIMYHHAASIMCRRALMSTRPGKLSARDVLVLQTLPDSRHISKENRY